MKPCDHKRRAGDGRVSALTICQSCRDFLCSLCGVTVEWRAGLCCANPGAQWRYCAKPACIRAEAEYHDLAFDDMIERRAALRVKRISAEESFGKIVLPLRSPLPLRRVASVASGSRDLPSGDLLSRPPRRAFKPERIIVSPLLSRRYLERGEACWCNLGKACVGDHEIFLGEPVHVCGECGEDFEISETDPHWTSGRGPICPRPSSQKGRA